MKKRLREKLAFVLLISACFLSPCKDALAYDGAQAALWMDQFAAALCALTPINDPAQTADPARAGQVLLEYEFGTVIARTPEGVTADDILEIDVRTAQVTDCRGVRVGMELAAALEGGLPVLSDAQLYVLGTQEAGYGWSWAYVSGTAVYGVEYIAYDGEAGGTQMKEYTLTYVIDEGVITSIRMKAADATLAQAQDGLETAEEMASRQDSEVTVQANQASALEDTDLCVGSVPVLGRPVAQLIRVMGEPKDIQTLPQGGGRILVYDGAAVTLGLHEQTGEEIVRALSVSTESIEGPRRLSVGMGVQEAAALFRCDQNLFSRGGVLYLAGEALGEPPYGEMTALAGSEMLLTYACQSGAQTALLRVGIQDGWVTYWQMGYLSDQVRAEGGM